MKREEFLNSKLFMEAFYNKQWVTSDKKCFSFGRINIEGYDMYLQVILGGIHDCVERISLI